MLEFFSGGVPRDGIPSIDDPEFETVAEADAWLTPFDPLMVFEHNGIVKGYPLQILLWHEIVNDTIGDLPILVTYCPLCNTAVVSSRRIDGTVYDFGTSGLLRGSNLVMYDRQTESWWQQFTGEALVGDMIGTTLEFFPSFHIAWAQFKEEYPGGLVLSRDTGYAPPYGTTPYFFRDYGVRSGSVYGTGDTDPRLPAYERVSAATIGGSDVAYPFSVLREQGVVNDVIEGKAIVVFFNQDPLSVQDQEKIEESRQVGATGVFEANVEGKTITFRLENGQIADTETGSLRNVHGRSVSGPLEGTQLKLVTHVDSYWFAWAAFKPYTRVYEPPFIGSEP